MYAPSVRAVTYTRVSTEEQADSGLGLDAQRTKIAAALRVKEWEQVAAFEDAGVSAKSMNGRHGLAEAIAMLKRHDADVLVVAKLDRLSRSMLDFAGLMERSRKEKWGIVALDLDVDTTTPAGKMMANVLMTFAEFERELIGERTKNALAVKKAQGVRLGRERLIPNRVRKQILQLHGSGMSLRAVAAELNRRKVATAGGGVQWYASTIRSVLQQAA